MDGWETRRKRTQGHDWAIYSLGVSGQIIGFDIDTAFFTGNNTPKVSIQAACIHSLSLVPRRENMMGTCASPEEMKAAEAIKSELWTTILPPTLLGPGYPETRHNLFFSTDQASRFTHYRVNMFPDGGIARLRVYGNVHVDWIELEPVVNVASESLGARAIAHSNAHYGLPKNLLQYPGRGINMADGWETARNPQRPDVFLVGDDGNLIIPGRDWCVIKLACPTKVSKIVFDTAHFKVFTKGELATADWGALLRRVKLEADKIHEFKVESSDVLTTHVRITIFPDGGLSRVHIFGSRQLARNL